jgi:copper(I)-binding protein
MPLPFHLARRLARLLAATLFLIGPCLQAADSTVGSLQILHPYARPTPPGARTAGVYFRIRNGGNSSDRLIGVSSPVAGSAEIHDMTMDGGIMRMRALPEVEIPAKATVEFAPGGFHLMLLELRRPLKTGDRFPLRLSFAKGRSADVEVLVEAKP